MLAFLQPVGEAYPTVSAHLSSVIEIADDPDTPLLDKSCDETVLYVVEPGTIQDTDQVLAQLTGFGSRTSGAAAGRRDLIAGEEPVWLYSAVASGTARSELIGNSVYEGGMTLFAEASEWGNEYIAQEHKACSRFDTISGHGVGAAVFRIMPDAGEQMGDPVFVEAYAVTNTDTTHPDDPERSVQTADAGLFITYDGEALANNVSGFEDFVPIGSYISFTGELQNFVRSGEMFELVNAYATIDFAAFIYSTQFSVDTEVLDVSDSSPSFGPYLDGVELIENFTITLDALSALNVVDVTAVFNSPILVPHPERIDDTNQWRFSYDMSLITEDTTLTVTARFADESERVLTKTIDLLEPAALHVTMKPTVSSDDPDPIENVRLIDGVNIGNAVFNPTITGIPENTLAAYEGMLDLVALTPGVTGELVIQEGVFANSPFSFTYSPDVLPVGEHQFVVMAAPEHRAREVKLSTEKPLLVIELPEWMSPFTAPAKQHFVAGGELGMEYPIDPQLAGYVIDIEFPGIDQAWAALKNADEFVKDFAEVLAFLLDANIQAAINLKAYAPLVHTLEGKLVPKSWEIGAVLAGRTLIEPDDGDIDVQGFSGSLAGKTLDLNVLNYNDVYDLKSEFGLSAFDVALGAGTVTIPLSVPGFNFKAQLAGTLAGEVSTAILTTNIRLRLTTVGNNIVLSFVDSFVSLRALASATLSVFGSAGVNAGVSIGLPSEYGEPGSFDLVQIAARGSATLSADALLKLNWAGPVNDLTVNTDGSYFDLFTSYDFDWKVCFFKKNCVPENEDETVKAKETDGKAIDLGDIADGIGEGLVDKASDGFPGVSPTDGDKLGVLGLPGGESPSPTAPQPAGGAPAETETARLTLVEPLNYAQRLEFDINALASVAAPTGSHRLEIVAVSPTTETPLDSIDLAALTFAANDNPLGFASGWSTRNIDLAAAELSPDEIWNVQVRLIADTASGEQVAVALDRVTFHSGSAILTPGVPEGDISDGSIDFGTDTPAPESAMLHVENTGDELLIVSDASIDSPAFTIAQPPIGLAVAPGGSFDLQIAVVDPSQPATATLSIVADDPDVSPVVLTLSYEPSSGNVEVEQVVVNGGDAQRTNLHDIALTFSGDLPADELIGSGAILSAVQVVDVTSATESIVPLTVNHYAWNAAANTLVVDLTVDGVGGVGATMLADGRYELRLNQTALPTLVDADGDPDGVHRAAFHRLYGDVDGDAAVGLLDLALLQMNFGRMDGAPGSYDLAGDGDLTGDGKVTASDAAGLAGQWGARLTGTQPASPVVAAPLAVLVERTSPSRLTRSLRATRLAAEAAKSLGQVEAATEATSHRTTLEGVPRGVRRRLAAVRS
jgi:hypothetical protein